MAMLCIGTGQALQRLLQVGKTRVGDEKGHALEMQVDLARPTVDQQPVDQAQVEILTAQEVTGVRVEGPYRIVTLDDGSEFDSSAGRDPLEFTVGSGQVIPGFDKAVEGMAVGDNKSVRLEPDEAYGPRHDQLVQEVDRSMLPDDLDPKEGMALQSSSPDGQVMQFMVTDVSEQSITVDANHPLAGQALSFDIELVEIS